MLQATPQGTILGKREQPESPPSKAEAPWVQLGAAIHAFKRAKRDFNRA